MSSKSESEETEPAFKKKMHTSRRNAHLKDDEKDAIIKTFINLRDNWPEDQYLSNKDVIDKTGIVLGVSTRTVYRILREYQTTNDGKPILRRKRKYRKKPKVYKNCDDAVSMSETTDASQIVETSKGMTLQPYNIQLIEKPDRYYKPTTTLEEITSLDRSKHCDGPKLSLAQTTLRSMLSKPSTPPLSVIDKILHDPKNMTRSTPKVPQNTESQIKTVEKNGKKIYLHPIVIKDGVLTAPTLPKYLSQRKTSSSAHTSKTTSTLPEPNLQFTTSHDSAQNSRILTDEVFVLEMPPKTSTESITEKSESQLHPVVISKGILTVPTLQANILNGEIVKLKSDNIANITESTELPSVSNSPNELAISLKSPTNSPNDLATLSNELATLSNELASWSDELATSPNELATSPNELATSPNKLATSPNDLATMPNGLNTLPKIKVEIETEYPDVPIKEEIDIEEMSLGYVKNEYGLEVYDNKVLPD